MRYGTCTVCGEPHQLTQPTGAPPAAIVIVAHGSSGHPDWLERCPGSGIAAADWGSVVADVDASGATIGRPERNVIVSWEMLRMAAAQEDRDLAAKYQAILDVARHRAAKIKDRFGCHITGHWYEWEDDDREPCAAIVADGLARPRIPGRARVTRRADPDEVAAAHRSARTGDEIRIYAAGLEPLPRPVEWWDHQAVRS